MTNGQTAAVTEATRLGEIGFPEFTAKLITDTFDALVAANIKQTEAYIELVRAVSLTLKDYINETKDDIDGEMILQMLAKVLPDPTHESGTKVRVNGELESVTVGDETIDDAQILNDALTVPGESEPEISNGTINQETFDDILEAVATRIAADKYTLLNQMVKMGILRLVVEKGVIETRLTFKTFGSTFYQANKSDYDRVNTITRKKSKTGGLLSFIWGYSSRTTTNSLAITTASETNRDTSGSQVQIYGSVRIEFKTDYSPLTT